ncbi:DHH family phosphoesterase [Coprococcus eutactus]|uniref:DHH family phosphoesterase n=1 Tax=Coprococcus eutactus TaxID=33043 RepID=UPI000EE60EBB|nr:DHH family phosphoesterase [Coprococcus eutactus]MCB5505108.1 DHH family phosphoesterase [Coprococcus eutactus]NSC96909.1 signaling protein consisting of a modified GGDEF domain and a DHH domain protein [Coprococcus eutactus]NSD35940.1 signaling protein consisting of a modified GGDEF domain and a DHH domain protein [Coprococcus eutactus]HAB87653.1 signaling protein consisting of a modified GGDEF domain and a DHH domain protein [Coprococcus sp.]
MNDNRHTDTRHEIYLQMPLYVIALFVLCDIWMLTVSVVAGIVGIIFTAVYSVVVIVLYISSRVSSEAAYANRAMENGRVQKDLIREFPIPYAILDKTGRLAWVNDEFAHITNTSKRKLMRLTAMQVFEGLPHEMIPGECDEPVHADIEYDGKEYRVEIKNIRVNPDGPVDSVQEQETSEHEEEMENLPVTEDQPQEKKTIKRKKHTGVTNFTAMYLFDMTERNKLAKENEEQKLVTGLIYIDNYDEIFDDLEEVRHSLLVALVDRKINKYMANVDAIVRSFEKDKYMFVMPKKYLPQLQENKFALLDEVKAINIGNDLPLTLSISLGTEYKSFIEDFEAARSAMELALGRGGDQVVLKSNDKITYYGGRSQGTEKSTRVKARVKTLAFKELLETKEKVIIMAHKNPDMDAFGSAIGVYRMVNSMNKEAHIVINEVSSAISPIYGNFTANSMYGDDMIINNEQAIEMINADTMLVVVDVNNPSLTECEELISYAKTVVVFDHHRQTKDVIANATLSYVEPFASSACEMIAEMLQYMDEKIKLRPSEADAMYAGILIDTDNFLTKTGVRTFEAAAYLRRSGADVMRVRKMFRSDIDSYRQKADGVRNAEMVLGMFAVSVFEPKEGPESPIVLTAKVANEMLNIAGVRASFVIAQLGDDVKISARSIDDVNVQIIMERMGGGGHANIAAAQFKNTTKEEVKEQLVNLLEEMYKEGDI